MISLNDYLYNGDTVLKIMRLYSMDLKSGNEMDQIHSKFLDQLASLLEHNDFLTSQSQKLREFYKYMADRYPYLAFTFKGRIKSLIRAEEKFNGYIVEYFSNYYLEHHEFCDLEDLKNKLLKFRDLIAYRIVISMPKCHLDVDRSKEEVETWYLYQIANELPGFLKEYGFIPQINNEKENKSSLLDASVQSFYRDYITNPSKNGYKSLHITFYDTYSSTYFEIQLRTKDMDDLAEIGSANHLRYELRQNSERSSRYEIPNGNVIFDEAYARGILLQGLDLSKIDVNMFTAINNDLMNDGCGLYRGRLILPYEHLSRFQK
jgi:hypothetical protein